ncbi:hypothetical protein AOQ84DRAFT_24323 [Glonium stellatum]|uniref:MHYT domain-containing protein n=1 Tax=Glonium stellatum TaxID=574774 RepID=A0A8E2F2Y3_9PEZI|nr:hypothetical protein AOQ84DRAFT_24323 [Glonium stellatum]
MGADGKITTKYRIGDEVPFHFLWYLILASYFVSLVGAYTTVELLHRRKTGNGWLSWLQLGGCSVSFGLVAIWCMHFVGNRAIVLGDGKNEIQLYYNPGFTALSVFLPIIFLFFGFAVAERFTRTKRSLYLALTVTGLAAGLAITGMHYIGNFGTTNYYLYNNKSHIVGAAAIAVVACWFSFTLFFHQKEHWINTGWRRVLIACLLAGAVSGMHWTATVGTKYELRGYHRGSGADRNNNLIVATAMCLLACAVCFALAFLIQRRRRQLADRAQHVVLASATFDPDGRLLVTQEGLMPSQKITKQYNQRSFNDEFNVAHPAFQWLFRVTRNWQGVADLVPAMKTHLRFSGGSKMPTRPDSTESRSTWEEANGEDEYSAIFREHFCVAASDLADHLDTSVQDLGVLYEEILMTGTLMTELRTKRTKTGNSKDILTAQVATKPADIEAGLVIPSLFGRGQLLFVVRKVDKAEASRLMNVGYRFAHADQVSDLLARSMQIKRADLVSTVEKLRTYCQRDPCVPPAGTYLACFALRPAVKASSGNWDILVPRANPGRLPMVRLSSEQLESWQSQFISRLDGFSLTQCIQYLSTKASEGSSDEGGFAKELRNKVVELVDEVPEVFFRQAIFSARPVRTDYIVPGDDVPSQVTVMAFCIIPDVHSASVRGDKLIYTPFSFFKCQQRAYTGCPDHSVLARRNHREFSSLLARQREMVSAGPLSHRGSFSAPVSVRVIRMWPFSKNTSPRDTIVQPDSSSEKELVQSHSRAEENNTSHAFGGIMVSQDITVNANTKSDSQLELRDLGIRSEAGVAATEQPTFADELFKITTSKWQRP